MNPEVLTAEKWYRWLWLSPLLTIPSVGFLVFNEPGYGLICGLKYPNCDYALSFLVSGIIAVLGSALWHLILLFPALNKQSEFERWHGRQALLIAGIRTIIVAMLSLAFPPWSLWGILVLVGIWLGGFLWGMGQVRSGDCALMHWTGHGAGLPIPIAKPIAKKPQKLGWWRKLFP